MTSEHTPTLPRYATRLATHAPTGEWELLLTDNGAPTLPRMYGPDTLLACLDARDLLAGVIAELNANGI